jgi:5-methyltetrahydrofolate--homocysteine methyltransferase
MAQHDGLYNAVIQGRRNDVKVLVGGALVTREFAKEIGAHGYAEDAASAVRALERLLAA